jgi:hypothetical protein
MTTIRKPNGTETSSLHETVNVILDYHFTEDSEEDNSHHKNIIKSIEEPIRTNEDADFTQEEIEKHNRELQLQESTWIKWDHRGNLSTNVPYVSQNNNHNIQGVTGGTDQNSGGCSLCSTIQKNPKTPISKV